MGYGPITPTKKRIDKLSVYHAAMLLIQSNGQTTSLEVKTQLRSLGFFAEQAEVSAFLQELQTEHSWEKETTGVHHNQHFAYHTNNPTTVTPVSTTCDATPLESDLIQLIKDTVWNRSTPPFVYVNSTLQSDLHLDHLNMIQIGLAIDAKYDIKTMKEDWNSINTVKGIVDMVIRLDPSLNSHVASTGFNAVLSPAYDGVREVISDNLGIPKSEILLASTMRDLKISSLDLVEIAMELEQHFNISIPDDKLEDIKTVNDLVQLMDMLLTPPTVKPTHIITPTPASTKNRKPKSVINDSVSPSKSPRVSVNIDPIASVSLLANAKSIHSPNTWYVYKKDGTDAYVYNEKYTSDNVRTVYARMQGIKIQDVRASRLHRM